MSKEDYTVYQVGGDIISGGYCVNSLSSTITPPTSAMAGGTIDRENPISDDLAIPVGLLYIQVASTYVSDPNNFNKNSVIDEDIHKILLYKMEIKNSSTKHTRRHLPKIKASGKKTRKTA